MCIETIELKIARPKHIGVESIEKEFRKRGYEPIRWAIVECSADELIISLSYMLIPALI